MPNLEVECKIVQETADEIQQLGEALAESSADQAKTIQKQFERKMEIYLKQLTDFKAQFPHSENAKAFEASYYGYLALLKVHGRGFLRRVSDGASNSALSLATGLIAKQQEKAAAKEALALLDQALAICDIPGPRFIKATVYYYLLKDKDASLQELRYIVSNFNEGDFYIQARKMKDELETPPKKKGWFS